MKVKIKNKELEELYLSLMGDNHMENLSQEDCMFLEKEYANAICCYRKEKTLLSILPFTLHLYGVII